MLPENKIGVFICHKEKWIKEAIDTDELKAIAQAFPQVQVVEDLYQDQWETSASRLSHEISEKGLSHLIIASCHSSNYQNTFQQELGKWGLSPDQVTLVNMLPEYLGVQIEPEVVRERSALLLKQAIRGKEIAEHHPLETVATVTCLLVIGGDLMALLAAQETLNLGYEVIVLVPEKTTGQGGYHSGSTPEKDQDQWEILSKHPGVRVIHKGRLVGLSGKAGDFKGVFQNGQDEQSSQSVGAIIVSLPVREDPNFALYGLTPGRKVLSLSQLEVMLASRAYREKVLPENQSREVAFLLGLSSESSPGVVQRALTNARLIQDLMDKQVYFLTGNMKVAGPGLERLYTQAREEGILFFRFDQGQPRILETGKGLTITFQDEILGRPLTLQPDLIIVDEKLRPHPELKGIADILGVSLDAAGFMAPDKVYALPVRTPRKGIFVVGGSRRPVTDNEDSLSEIHEAILSAADVIGKGTQECEAPWVEIDRKKCTICLTCVRSCPHQALSFLYRRPQISALACQVCGICASECPMDAIQIKHYRDQTVINEVAAFFDKRKFESITPQVVVFCCKNSADKTLQQALLYREPLPIGFEFIQVPCAGKIDPDYILQAFKEGADGVLILVCPMEACQSFEGNKRALERVRFLQEVLPEIGLEPERIQFETLAPGMVPQFLKVCYQMEDRFRKLGVSPVRRSLGIQRIYEKFTYPVNSATFQL